MFLKSIFLDLIYEGVKTIQHVDNYYRKGTDA